MNQLQHFSSLHLILTTFVSFSDHSQFSCMTVLLNITNFATQKKHSIIAFLTIWGWTIPLISYSKALLCPGSLRIIQLQVKPTRSTARKMKYRPERESKTEVVTAREEGKSYCVVCWWSKCMSSALTELLCSSECRVSSKSTTHSIHNRAKGHCRPPASELGGLVLRANRDKYAHSMEIKIQYNSQNW